MLSPVCPLLALAKLVLPLSGHCNGSTSHHGYGRSGPDSIGIEEPGVLPTRRGWGATPVAWTNQFTATRAHIQGLGLAHPDIYPIYVLLERIKGLILWNIPTGSP